MTEIIYSKEGEEQSLDLRFVFKVKFSPGSKHHLTQVLTSYFLGKGIQLETESHRIEIL